MFFAAAYAIYNFYKLLEEYLMEVEPERPDSPTVSTASAAGASRPVCIRLCCILRDADHCKWAEAARAAADQAHDSVLLLPSLGHLVVRALPPFRVTIILKMTLCCMVAFYVCSRCSNFLYRCKVCVFQYVIIKLILTVSTFILVVRRPFSLNFNAFDVLSTVMMLDCDCYDRCEWTVQLTNSFGAGEITNPEQGFVYVTVITNLSQLVRICSPLTLLPLYA